MKTKKASIQDLIFVAIVILVFAVVTLIAFKISDEINTQFSESDTVQRYDTDSKGRNAMNTINDMYPGVIDNSFLLLMIGLCIVALALASMVRVHPVFFVFFLIILIVIIFLAGVFSNIYIEIASNPDLSELADKLTFTTNLMKLLPLIIGVMGFLLSIVMYKSWQAAQ